MATMSQSLGMCVLFEIQSSDNPGSLWPSWPSFFSFLPPFQRELKMRLTAANFVS